MIRVATSADAGQIADIWNHAIRETVITFNPVEKTATDVVAMMTVDQPMLVWDVDGVQGFARYSQFRGGDGYRFSVEHTIMLRDGVQSAGAGRAMLTALCDSAKRAGKHMMFAGVSAENVGAVAFHTKMGFTTAAVLPEVGFKFGRWHDLVLMQKRL